MDALAAGKPLPAATTATARQTTPERTLTIDPETETVDWMERVNQYREANRSIIVSRPQGAAAETRTETRTVTCDACAGTGKMIKSCGFCSGSGLISTGGVTNYRTERRWVSKNSYDAAGKLIATSGYEEVKVPVSSGGGQKSCSYCSGKGFVKTSRDCNVCKGEGKLTGRF